MLEEIGIILAAELVRRLRSRAFIAGTAIGILAIGLLFVIPTLFERGTEGTTKTLVLAGPPDLRAPARALLERDSSVRIVDEVDRVPQPVTLAFLDEHRKASAVIVLSRGQRGLSAIVFARDPGGFPTGHIGRALIPLSIAIGTGMPATRLTPYARNPLDVRGVETRYATEASADLARSVAFGLVFILYFAIVFNSQTIMSSVSEEKTNRVAELLVSTIRPSALLAGKVIALGAAGLIQVGLWIVTGIVLSQSGGGLFGGAFDSAGSAASASAMTSLANALSPGEVAAFVLFFVIAYLQFAFLFAAAASLVNRPEDIGSLAGPLMLPIVAAFLIAQYTLIAPNGSTSVIASFIPLVSPFVMFTRMVIAEVPAWQVVLSIALNLVVLAAVVPLAGKIYRVGMLLYGQAPKLSQIWAVLRS